MPQISSAQIRAARAVLSLSREDLALSTHLSVATIRNLELGFISYKSAEAVREALETAGIEFTDNEGIRRRERDAEVLSGSNAAETFFEGMVRTLRTKGGDLAVVAGSRQKFLESLGLTMGVEEDVFRQIGALAEIRCLLTEEYDTAGASSAVHYRSISKVHAGPMPYYIFGSKCALLLREGETSFKFVLFHGADIAHSYLDHFDALWLAAAPVANYSERALKIVVR